MTSAPQLSAAKGLALASPSGAAPADKPAPLGGMQLSAPQKAALIIAALGPEFAAPIIERVEDKHLRSFARAYAQMQKVPQAALRQVVEEFVGRLSTREEAGISGGYERTKMILGQFMESDELEQLMDEVGGPGGQTVWQKLEKAPEDALAIYLSAQSPQIVAVVLSRINTENASRLLDKMEPEAAQQVIMRLAKPMEVRPEALKILGDTIEREFLAPLKKSADKHNPGEMIGAMMNNVMSSKRETFLNYISENAPDILKDVRKSMLTFEDIPERVPAKAIPMVIKEMELNDFLQAAKYGEQNAPKSVEFIFGNISQRMAQQYKEEMEKLKQISVEEAEALQSRFMTGVRQLVAKGEIELVEIVEPESEEEGAGEQAQA